MTAPQSSSRSSRKRRGVRIGIPRKVPSTRRSLSPATITSASPFAAVARIMRSFGDDKLKAACPPGGEHLSGHSLLHEEGTYEHTGIKYDPEPVHALLP